MNAKFIPLVNMYLDGTVLRVTARGLCEDTPDLDEFRQYVKGMPGIGIGGVPQLRKRDNQLECQVDILSPTAIKLFAAGAYAGLRLGFDADGRIAEIRAWDSPHAMALTKAAGDDGLSIICKRDSLGGQMTTRLDFTKAGDAYAGASSARHTERHPATGQFTPRASSIPEAMAADPRVAQIIAATWKQTLDDWNSSDESVDEVMQRARAATARALRQAGFNVDAILTDQPGQDASLSPRRAGSTPEPSAKMLKIDDVNGRLAKILANVKADATAYLERRALDRGDVDGVLQKRLVREERAAASGWMDLLKADDLGGAVDSVFGGMIAFSPVSAIRKSESELDPRIEAKITKGIKGGLEGDEFVAAATTRISKAAGVPLDALFTGDKGYAPRASFNPMLSNADPESQQRESLIKTLRTRTYPGEMNVTKLLD